MEGRRRPGEAYGVGIRLLRFEVWIATRDAISTTQLERVIRQQRDRQALRKAKRLDL